MHGYEYDMDFLPPNSGNGGNMSAPPAANQKLAGSETLGQPASIKSPWAEHVVPTGEDEEMLEEYQPPSLEVPLLQNPEEKGAFSSNLGFYGLFANSFGENGTAPIQNVLNQPALPAVMLVNQPPPLLQQVAAPVYDYPQVAEAVMAVPSTPGRPQYTCHICGSPNHPINSCPQKDRNPLTPYQGNKLSLGYFRCQCSHEFTQKMYANQLVKCPRCNTISRPYKMRALLKVPQ